MLSNYFPFFVPTLVVNNTAMPRFASILFEAILKRFVREPTGGAIEEVIIFYLDIHIFSKIYYSYFWINACFYLEK